MAKAGTSIVLLIGLGLALPASAKPLVAAGDLLVTDVDTILAVDAETGAVTPFSPRDGSGPNYFADVGEIVIDAEGYRVYATSPSNGRLIMIDPDTGAQTIVRDFVGAEIDVGPIPFGLAQRDDGSLVVATETPWTTSPPPIPVPFPGDAYLVDLVEPDALGRTFGGPLTGTLDVGQYFRLRYEEFSTSGPIVRVSSLLSGTISNVDTATSTLSPMSSFYPHQPGARVSDFQLDCGGGLASLCAMYWTELEGTACDPVGAAVFARAFLSFETVYAGPPLRCPMAVRRDGPDRYFVLDTWETGPAALWRFDRVNGSFEPTFLTAAIDEQASQFWRPASMAITPVPLPEPGAAGLMVAVAVVALLARRRRSTALAPRRS